MPEIQVFCAAGRSREQKRLMKRLTDAVVLAYDVDPEVVTVQIIEAPTSDKSKGGIPFDERNAVVSPGSVSTV